MRDQEDWNAEREMRARIAELELALAAAKRERDELRAVLEHLEQAYSNKHSPRHRQAAIAEARAALKSQREG